MGTFSSPGKLAAEEKDNSDRAETIFPLEHPWHAASKDLFPSLASAANGRNTHRATQMELHMDRFSQIAADLSLTDAPAVHPVDEAHFQTRQDAARRACVDAGIVWPATILPEGTALYESGTETLKADRARWQKLPDAATGVRVVKAALAAEDRRDFKVPVNELRLDNTARLYRIGRDGQPPPAGYDKHAFRQLVAQTPGCGAGEAPRAFATALLHLDADERADILNRRLPRAEVTTTVRTKLSTNGKRIVRAVLSERYGDVNDIHVADAIESSLNGDARTAKLDYKPGDKRSQFEVIFPSQVPVKTFVVGDVHYAGFTVQNSETGEGALTIRAFMMRAACANLTLAPGDGVSIRHIGNGERLAGQLKAGVMAALGQLDPLIATIQRCAGEDLSFTNKSPSELIAQLAKKYAVSGERAQAWADTYEQSYAQSPTTWGITSAITEAAQGAEWWGAQSGEEAIASEVMGLGLRKALGF